MKSKVSKPIFSQSGDSGLFGNLRIELLISNFVGKYVYFKQASFTETKLRQDKNTFSRVLWKFYLVFDLQK